MARSGTAELEPVGSAGRMQKVGSDDPTAAVLRPAAKGESTSRRRRWPEPYRPNVSRRRRQSLGGAGLDLLRVFSLPLARASSRPGQADPRPRVVVRLAQGEGSSRAGREEPAPTVPSKRERRFVGSATSALWALRRRGSERSVQLERAIAAGHGRPRTVAERVDRLAWSGRQCGWNGVAVQSDVAS